MNKYLVKIIFRIIAKEENDPIGLFEEKLRLIKGENDRDALYHASVWGQKDASEFINASGQRVRWEFIAVSELYSLPPFMDSMKPDSHLEEMPAEAFIALQKNKQKRLLYLAAESLKL